MTAACQTSTCDDGLAAFMSVRGRLFGIAYRMLKSAAEAEDVVQDVWLRWQAADRSLVRDAVAFLATTTTRLAINVVQSARSRRETHVESGQPEPVDGGADPRLAMERGQALASGAQLLLEKLTATERAAFILREAFDHPYREIANLLGLAEANARQIVARARQHLANGRKMPASATARRRLLDAFIAAAHDGDVAGLAALLASDARLDCGSRSRTFVRWSVTTHLRVRSRARRGGGGSAPASIEAAQRERDIDHETRHHRRHRIHRIQAGHQVERAWP